MKTTQKEIEEFLGWVNLSPAKNDGDLGYKDPFETSQQKKRDEKVTELLSEYVSAYKKKVDHSTACRYLILIPCMVIVIKFAFLLENISTHLMDLKTAVPITDLVAYITACVSFISLIIGLLTIITKYFFPENDEQYITKIVESIQKNDLENKKENAKHQQKPQEQDSEKDAAQNE